MGIINIHILTDPNDDLRFRPDRQVEALQQALIEQHRRGMHTYGNMRRECPLCQAGK